MKHFYIIIFLLLSLNIQAQISIENGINTYLINFDSELSGVNGSNFNGNGFHTSPTSGQLDADAWATTGLSDGSKDFGINNITGDHARGSTSGGVSTGGLYGVDLGGGNKALGIQPTGSDWTPGTITLKIVNNSVSIIEDLNVDYLVYVRNDQNRSSSFNFSYSLNNTNFIDITAADYTSPVSAGSTTWTPISRNIQFVNLSLNPGSEIYIRWAGSDVSGSGSRDEFALDDIQIIAEGSSSTCLEPTSQATNLNFGTVTSNSIQATFSPANSDKFLIVQSTNSSLGQDPVDGVVYPIGSSIGSGEVIQYDNTTSINSTGLLENTTYYYYIFSSNDVCTGGPDYLVQNPLIGSATTDQDSNNGYYSGITNETCDALKTALHNLIDNHTVVSYNSLWTHYQTTDDHLNDSGNETIVWDMYSDNPNGAENEFSFISEQCGTYQMEGDCYNREHTFPRSWWGGSTSVPQYTDIFTVIPADGWINGIRSNNPYGEVQGGTESQITNNGCKLGSSSINIPGYTSSVFEPTDDYKGDLARGYFYMATRYEDNISSWETNTSESDAVLDGSSYPAFESWFIDMLISWHNLDPVDQKEIDRNQSIYLIQGNRNPFIDHPEYVGLIWNNCSSGGPDTEAPTIPQNLLAYNIQETTIDLSWDSSTDNVGVLAYNIIQDGIHVASTSNTSATISGLSSGTNYTFSVTAYDAAGNESIESNPISLTTLLPDTESPTEPANLMASDITTSSTILTWDSSTDNVGIEGYNIYQDGIIAYTTTNLSTTILGLQEGTTYLFHVIAFDAAGNQSNSSNILTVTTATATGPTLVHEGYFETGWDNWQDGGNDCSRYSGSFSYEGNYSIQLRDNSGTSSSMTSPTFDLSSFDEVNLEFSFYPRSMENNEDFWLRYFDGTSWQTIATFVKGVDFQNNTFYTTNISLSNSSYNLSNNAKFRFQCDASGNNDKIYIDAVVINGSINGGSARITEPSITEVSKMDIHNSGEEVINSDQSIEEILIPSSPQIENTYLLYPNPASTFVNIDLSSSSEKIFKIEIYDIMGRYIETINTDFSSSIIKKDISNFENGIYLVRIIDSSNKSSILKLNISH